MSKWTPAAKSLAIRNLEKDLDVLIDRYNSNPSRCNAQRVRGIRLELQTLRTEGK
jgi:hypothetical protein